MFTKAPGKHIIHGPEGLVIDFSNRYSLRYQREGLCVTIPLESFSQKETFGELIHVPSVVYCDPPNDHRTLADSQVERMKAEVEAAYQFLNEEYDRRNGTKNAKNGRIEWREYYPAKQS